MVWFIVAFLICVPFVSLLRSIKLPFIASIILYQLWQIYDNDFIKYFFALFIVTNIGDVYVEVIGIFFYVVLELRILAVVLFNIGDRNKLKRKLMDRNISELIVLGRLEKVFGWSIVLKTLADIFNYELDTKTKIVDLNVIFLLWNSGIIFTRITSPT